MEQKTGKRFFVGKFSESWRGYLASAVNLLTNTNKTSPNTRGDIFGINFAENDERTWQKGSHGDLANFGTLSHIDCESVL